MLITDPDNLTYELANSPTSSYMLTVDLADKLISLTQVGALTTDGVTLKCIYSKLKEIWKNEAAAIKYKFPMVPITDEQFEIIDGWDFGDNASRYLVRTGGWALKDNNGVSLEEWAGVITLGSVGGSDQIYFRQVSGDGSPTNFQLTGPINQSVKVYGDATHGNFNYRSYLKLFCREQAKSYDTSDLTAIGVTTMSYQVYRFPISNTNDIKVTESDVTVDAYGVTITWYGAAQSRSINGVNRDFHVIINGNNKTAEEIYMAVQSALRKSSDIDAGAGTKTGKITNELLEFVGDTLYTKLDSTGGTYIDNFQVADTNRLVFVDDTGTERTFNYVASLQINFNSYLQSDTSAIYRVFFTTNPSGNFGTANAIIVDDNDGVDMAGLVGGAAFVQHSFNYDGNTQGGRTAGTDAGITVVAIGLDTAQYVSATGTIQRSTSNQVSLSAPIERNYDT